MDIVIEVSGHKAFYRGRDSRGLVLARLKSEAGVDGTHNYRPSSLVRCKEHEVKWIDFYK